MAALAEVMERMAQGDGAAVVELVDRWGQRIAGAVRSVASSRGARLSYDETQELVWDAALAVQAVAGGWSPEGGALPWVWGRHHVAAVVDRHIGQHAEPLERAEQIDGPAAAPSPGAERPVLDQVRALARHHREVALLAEALDIVATPRDQVLFLETALQASLGDASPSHTVGELLGMAPAAVRQQHRRVRLRVQALAAEDERYAPLATLALVA